MKKPAPNLALIAVVAVVAVGCDATGPESASDLVAWWSFNDELTADNSGNGYDVAAYGAATDEGIIGHAAALTGADYLVAEAGPTPEAGGARSISLWFYKASGLISGDYESLVWQTGALTLDIRGAEAPFDLHLAVESDAGTVTSVVADQSVVPGQWHHVIAVMSNDGADAGLRLWIDRARSEAALLPEAVAQTEHPLVFGKSEESPGTPRYFNGRLDEIRLYNRALNQADVNQLFSEAD